MHIQITSPATAGARVPAAQAAPRQTPPPISRRDLRRLVADMVD